MAEKQTFQQAMDRLEEITAKLEKNEISLEEAISLFEEGLHLVNDCDQQLKQFEAKVATLMNDYEAGEGNE